MATFATVMTITGISVTAIAVISGILLVLDIHFGWFNDDVHWFLTVVFGLGLLAAAITLSLGAALSDFYKPKSYTIVHTINGETYKVAEFRSDSDCMGYVDGKRMFFPDIRSYETSDETYVWDEYRQEYGIK